MPPHAFSLDQTFLSDQKVLPSDHHDSNHPHYPHDVEKQSGRRRSLWNNKIFLTAVLLVLIMVCMTGSIFSGIALGRMGGNNVKAPESVTVIASSSTPARHEVQTVLVTATTVIYTITRVPQLYVPDAATATMTMSPSPVALDAPLRPILTKKALAMPGPSAVAVEVADAPTPPMALSDGESSIIESSTAESSTAETPTANPDDESPEQKTALRCYNYGSGFTSKRDCISACPITSYASGICERDVGALWACWMCF
ncbi:hypothetical protein E8E13_003859 [Curvularia kusanoi]|uniref:Uncharacterized protein n=1 Tax=Curvularia kusanoi TaxID=90978 RepID=A0A9P4W667_CURKU|nr:hypothetical protein E8E13_003859 [Curvularia kusanoi]